VRYLPEPVILVGLRKAVSGGSEDGNASGNYDMFSKSTSVIAKSKIELSDRIGKVSIRVDGSVQRENAKNTNATYTIYIIFLIPGTGCGRMMK